MDQASAMSYEPGTLCFRCNICGERCQTALDRLGREEVSCKGCGSSPRARAIIRVLSTQLFGKNLLLSDFPARRDIRGLGMTDWKGYATRLAEKFSYRNTYYHQEPRLDISAVEIPAHLVSNDFVISSEVFEHVVPPVSRAFENVSKMLKPGGLFILTVPYTNNKDTIEHFPELYDFTVVEDHEAVVLRNRTREGVIQEFRNLVFHGGPGTTLEMRVFSENSIIQHLSNAAFHAIKVHRGPDFAHGVWWPESWAFPISARSNMLPMIMASPNPVPAGEGAGTTTITWNTGDETIGYVYVSVNDREESFFGRAPQSSSAANWIQTGFRYQFRLYDGTERGKLLAETTVTRNEPRS
jgi:SAM-dependent methyltransferase